MNEPTLQALRESIAHWDRMASGNRDSGEDMGPHTCSLCKMFNSMCFPKLRKDGDLNGSCDGCPVKDRTGKDGCNDTPYIQCEEFEQGEQFDSFEEYYDSYEFKDLALLELEFLRSLIPTDK